MLGPDSDDREFLGWLINFATLGVSMTEPVEGWIRRAGIRCQQIGLQEVGDYLLKHSAHERDHHLMMIDDSKHLANRWRRLSGDTLDVTALIERPASSSIQAYVDLHERANDSDTPFRQVAIEAEIERLALVVGPRMIERCRRAFGDEGLSEMSFVTSHVELDVGHTAFNDRLMQRLLDVRPDAVDLLVQTGTDALACYMDFLTDCLSTDFRDFRVKIPA